MCGTCFNQALVITILIALWHVSKKDGLAGANVGEYHSYQDNGSFMLSGQGNRGIYVGRGTVPTMQHNIKL